MASLASPMMASTAKPWLKCLPAESLRAEMPQQTIYTALTRIVDKHPSSYALYYYGTRLTYRELLARIDRLAAAFYGMGVRAGDYVSFLMPTTPESIMSLYAVNKLGATPNFIDPRMDTGRILDAAEGVRSHLLISIDIAYPKVAKILDRLSMEKIVFCSPNTSLPAPLRVMRTMFGKQPKIPYGDRLVSWKSFLDGASEEQIQPAPYRDGSTAAIVYTGGTTGTPKGVLLSDDGLNTMAESFYYSGAEYGDNDRFLAIMPIFASYGVGCGIHMPLTLGFELVVIPKFKPAELGFLLVKYHPNHMIGVPSFYEQIMVSKATRHADLSFLLSTGCGGDTMNPGLEDRFNAFLRSHGAKYSLSQGYGMSEMSGAATACLSANYKDGSSGIPLLATTAGIFDPETYEELPIGAEGEICLTGRNMMLGYYNNPEETANVMRTHKDGTTWVHSGDIGCIDEDGFLYIKGRIKQIIIKFDGHKVFPVSLEGILGKFEEVVSCAVVGIPDPDHAQGEVPLCVVELVDPTLSEEAREALRVKMLQHCDEVCEERGRPADVVFIPEMLYTGLQKHDYRRLREQYKDHMIRPH